VTFSLMTIFPISGLLSSVLSVSSDVDAENSGNWAATNRPVPASVGVLYKVRQRHEPGGSVNMERVDLMSRARSGDGDAFRELTEPFRRELQVHCYRMLGSLQDAEDALQDTLLAAWQGFEGF